MAGVFGGIVLFIWSSISWMALPFHSQSFKTFENQGILRALMIEGSRSSGVYLVPNPHGKDKSRMQNDDAFAFVVWNRDGWGNMGTKMLIALAEDILTALAAAWLLSLSRIGTFALRVLFIAGLGLFAALAVRVQDHLWWSYSPEYTAAGVADLLIAWSLAGLVISKILSRPDNAFRD